MNETLEAMARATFKSWFVDFDPVRAKAKGGQPPCMDVATAALFPDSFEGSPFGKIPKGWRIGKLAEIASLSRNSVNPSAFPSEVFHHYSIPAFDEGRWPKQDSGAQIKSNKSLIQRNSVLLSKLNPRFPRVWMPSLSAGSRSIASTEFLVTSAREPFDPKYLFGLFTSQNFFNVFATLVTGTSGSHQRVRAEFLHEMDVVIPDEECVASFSRAVGPLYASVAENLKESRTLSAIRDALLPKLISGEIRTSTVAPAEHGPVLPITEQPGTHHASENFKIAVLISTLVRTLATVQFPLGRKRYNKLVYLVHRKAAQQEQIGERFMKKAAGPYSPWMRYQGPEGIAIKNGYVKRLNGSKGSGFVSGNNIGQIDKYISRYGFTDPLNWVVNTFRYRTNDDLELLTTVDFAVLDLLASGKPITTASVRELIASEPNWAPKLERAIFSEEKIAKALKELDQYFGLKQV